MSDPTRDLQEQLARRLCDVFNDKADRTREEYQRTPEDQRDRLGLWKAVAAECMRQMEWARLHSYAVPGGGISLAPDDWQP